jgi:hypothetical protein
MISTVYVAKELLLFVEVPSADYACWRLSSAVLSSVNIVVVSKSSVGRSTNAKSCVSVDWVLYGFGVHLVTVGVPLIPRFLLVLRELVLGWEGFRTDRAVRSGGLKQTECDCCKLFFDLRSSRSLIRVCTGAS